MRRNCRRNEGWWEPTIDAARRDGKAIHYPLIAKIARIIEGECAVCYGYGFGMKIPVREDSYCLIAPSILAGA